jgi:ATP phosphoribosyltransferase
MLTTTAHQQWERKEIKLALPDGHQQIPTSQFLTNIGVEVSGYSEGNRRPSTNISWLSIKVIRPQDMPLQVANGNFDLAITGEDWLTEHLYRFPLSPVEKLLTLGFGKVKIAAAISQSLAVKNVTELKEIVRSGQLSRLRVASEYINIADRYLWEKRISPYKLVPIYGASEAFLPEDADLLIDNTQTGRTLAQHNLKVIDVLFESTACLVGNKYSISHKKEKIDFLLQIFAGGKKL